MRGALTTAQVAEASLRRFTIESRADKDGLLTNPGRLTRVPGSTRTQHPAAAYTIDLGAMRSAILATTTNEQRINTFSQFLHDGSAISTYVAVYIRVCDLPRLKENHLALITKLAPKK